MSDVKFSSVVKQRLLYIFLYDKRSKLPIRIFLSSFESDYNIIKTICDCYSISPICILTWLHNPYVSEPIGVFILLYLLIIPSESFELLVLCPFGDMKSERNDCEWIDIL